ncbi:MAG: tetratricopeptide repeat protein [Candidatus Odinarchaeota archaeon]
MEIINLLNSSDNELLHIEHLIYECKFEEALNRIINLEKKKDICLQGQLEASILKGKVYLYSEKYNKAAEAGELAYNLSQKLKNTTGIIDALLIKAYIIFSGKLEKAYNFITEAENQINSLPNESSLDICEQKANLILIKSIIFRTNNDLNKALELALNWLNLKENTGKKLDISRIYWHLGEIYLYKSDPDTALEFAMKSLAIQKELNNPVGIATSLNLIGLAYYCKGNFNFALKYCKKSLFTQKVSIRTKIDALHNIGAIYKEIGEINRTLRYYRRAIALAEEEDYTENYILNVLGIGTIYRMKGEYNKALEYFNLSLELSNKIKSLYGMSASLFYLTLINIDFNIIDQAQKYLNQLEEQMLQTGSIIFKQAYKIAKALILKKSGRLRNHTKAEMLLKQITEKKMSSPLLYLLSFVNLCELFLYESALTNSMEALDELNPLITQLSKIAENQNAYLWLAEIKLLQAKVAMIQMKIKDAEQLLTHAQQIAEIHGLNLLAMKISSEHDYLLDHLKTWDDLEKKNASLAERIKLASFKGVIDHMQGKRVLEVPNLIHEIPVLLLIIGEGGIPLLSIAFTEELSFEDGLISGFLSAFDSFSGALFSKRLDRAKFGDYTILITPVSQFSVCYLFKGQTFLAKKKLIQFVEYIKKSDNIWDILNKYHKINLVIDLKDHPSFEFIINEIFIRKVSEINV